MARHTSRKGLGESASDRVARCNSIKNGLVPPYRMQPFVLLHLVDFQPSLQLLTSSTMSDISEKHDRLSEARDEEVRPDTRKLADVVPDHGKLWFRVPHILQLNILLLVPLITSYVSGFDGSMLNGMQSVPRWQEGMVLMLPTSRPALTAWKVRKLTSATAPCRF